MAFQWHFNLMQASQVDSDTGPTADSTQNYPCFVQKTQVGIKTTEAWMCWPGTCRGLCHFRAAEAHSVNNTVQTPPESSLYLYTSASSGLSPANACLAGTTWLHQNSARAWKQRRQYSLSRLMWKTVLPFTVHTNRLHQSRSKTSIRPCT